MFKEIFDTIWFIVVSKLRVLKNITIIITIFLWLWVLQMNIPAGVDETIMQIYGILLVFFAIVYILADVKKSFENNYDEAMEEEEDGS